MSTIFQRIVQRLYDDDGDHDRTGIRYYAGPEYYVRQTIDMLCEEIPGIKDYLNWVDEIETNKLDEPPSS